MSVDEDSTVDAAVTCHHSSDSATASTDEPAAVDGGDGGEDEFFVHSLVKISHFWTVVAAVAVGHHVKIGVVSLHPPEMSMRTHLTVSDRVLEPNCAALVAAAVAGGDECDSELVSAAAVVVDAAGTRY